MKAQVWILLWALTGCGGAVNSRTVSRADIGYPQRTRLTGYVVSGGIGGHEDTPGQVPRTAVLDEAVLDEAVLESDGRRDCVVLTMRTALDRDDTLSQWTATLNGIQAYPEGEMVVVNDYAIHGERVVVDAAYATPFAAGSIQITQPTTKAWRVVERTARYCQPAAPQVVLQLEYSKSRGDYPSQLGFSWTLQ